MLTGDWRIAGCVSCWVSLWRTLRRLKLLCNVLQIWQVRGAIDSSCTGVGAMPFWAVNLNHRDCARQHMLKIYAFGK